MPALFVLAAACSPGALSSIDFGAWHLVAQFQRGGPSEIDVVDLTR